VSSLVKRVLVVHADSGLVQHIRQNLERDGHQVMVEPEGSWALAQVRKFNPDLVIADLLILESGEYSFLRQLRMVREDLPVLVLSPRSEEASRVRGFRLGTDDFLVQPFGVTELHRRIDALLASQSQPAFPFAPPVETITRFGEIEIHTGSRTVLRKGTPVALRLKEFDLLMALVARAGRVVSRVDLLREVWGYRNWVATRTVDTHVAELRRKLERDPARPDHILTVRKIGYRLERDAPV
jgi:DNA-binding response OmpR family regulator